jgi:hypothetical protein
VTSTPPPVILTRRLSPAMDDRVLQRAHPAVFTRPRLRPVVIRNRALNHEAADHIFWMEMGIQYCVGTGGYGRLVGLSARASALAPPR